MLFEIELVVINYKDKLLTTVFPLLTKRKKTQLTASDQLFIVYTCLPNATLILFEILTTAPVNALYYIEIFQGHKTENAFI